MITTYYEVMTSLYPACSDDYMTIYNGGHLGPSDDPDPLVCMGATVYFIILCAENLILQYLSGNFFMTVLGIAYLSCRYADIRYNNVTIMVLSRYKLLEEYPYVFAFSREVVLVTI